MMHPGRSEIFASNFPESVRSSSPSMRSATEWLARRRASVAARNVTSLLLVWLFVVASTAMFVALRWFGIGAS